MKMATAPSMKAQGVSDPETAPGVSDSDLLLDRVGLPPPLAVSLLTTRPSSFEIPAAGWRSDRCLMAVSAEANVIVNSQDYINDIDYRHGIRPDDGAGPRCSQAPAAARQPEPRNHPRRRHHHRPARRP